MSGFLQRELRLAEKKQKTSFEQWPLSTTLNVQLHAPEMLAGLVPVTHTTV